MVKTHPVTHVVTKFRELQELRPSFRRCSISLFYDGGGVIMEKWYSDPVAEWNSPGQGIKVIQELIDADTMK